MHVNGDSPLIIETQNIITFFNSAECTIITFSKCAKIARIFCVFYITSAESIIVWRSVKEFVVFDSLNVFKY